MINFYILFKTYFENSSDLLFLNQSSLNQNVSLGQRCSFGQNFFQIRSEKLAKCLGQVTHFLGFKNIHMDKIFIKTPKGKLSDMLNLGLEDLTQTEERQRIPGEKIIKLNG